MMPDFPLEETEPNWNKMTCPSLHSQQMVEKPGRNWEVSSVSCSFHSHEGLGNPKHIALTSVQGSNNNISGHRAGVSYWDVTGRWIDTLANNCSTQSIQIGHQSHFPSILRLNPSPSSKGVTLEAPLMRLMVWFVFLFKGASPVCSFCLHLHCCPAHQCSSQHYLQQLGHRSNLDVHWHMNEQRKKLWCIYTTEYTQP